MKKDLIPVVVYVFFFTSGIFAQPWNYDFGTNSDTISHGSSTNFLPAADSKGGTPKVSVGFGGGNISLDNPGVISFGSGSELDIVAPNGDSPNKFSIFNYSPGKIFVLKFDVRFSGGGGGGFLFFQGRGNSFSNDTLVVGRDAFTDIGWNLTDSDKIRLSYRANTGNWIADNDSVFRKNTNYTVLIIGNNTDSLINYSYLNSNHRVLPKKWHMWVGNDIILFNKDKDKIPDTSDVNSFTFFGTGNQTNTSTMHLDNLEYSNSLGADGTILSPLIAPANLTAVLSLADSHHVHLAWVDNSANELGFIIQRKIGNIGSPAPYKVIDSVAANILAYTDTLVHDTTTYTYRIYGFNDSTTSSFSNPAEITTPLPVELISFSAAVSNGTVRLTWETAAEINNAGFGIQRSRDRIKFDEIAFVKGSGTTIHKSSYEYTDKSGLSGKYFYRLKQINFDGSFIYLSSAEADISLPKEYSLTQNYPNPFNPSTTINFVLPAAGNVTIKLFNALGQEITNIVKGEFNAGIHAVTFNAGNLSSGVYFYRMEAAGSDGTNNIFTKRMILLK